MNEGTTIPTLKSDPSGRFLVGWSRGISCPMIEHKTASRSMDPSLVRLPTGWRNDGQSFSPLLENFGDSQAWMNAHHLSKSFVYTRHQAVSGGHDAKVHILIFSYGLLVSENESPQLKRECEVVGAMCCLADRILHGHSVEGSSRYEATGLYDLDAL